MFSHLSNPTFNVNKISAIISVSGLVMGMDISSLVLFIGSEKFASTFGSPNSIEQGFLVGASPLGGLVGCLLYAVLVERIDRVNLFRIGSIIWINGSLMNVLSFDIWLIAFSRWIKGIAVGVFSILVAAYTSEVIPKERKGRSIALVQLSFSFSILLMYYLSFGLNYLDIPFSYRFAWSFEMLPGIFLLISTIWLPESPSWLILHGFYEKAEDIQNKLAFDYGSKNETQTIETIGKLELVLTYQESSKKFAFKDLFGRNYWRQTAIGSTLQVLIQFSGINILMYYIIFICDMIGLEDLAKVTSASIPYIINFLLSVLPITFLDHVRRKDITLAGSFPLGILMIIIGTLMGIYGHQVEPINGNSSLVWSIDRSRGPLILGLCFLFVAIFSLTLSSGPWIYTNEILPTRAKAKALPICMSMGWLANSIMILLAPKMMALMKWGTFVLVGIFTLILSALILFTFPDTKNLTQREVDSMYNMTEDRIEQKQDIPDEPYHTSPLSFDKKIAPQDQAPIDIIEQ